jgi:hypothetical protein
LQVRGPLVSCRLIVKPIYMRLLLSLFLSVIVASAGDARLNLTRTPSAAQVQLSGDVATEYQIEAAGSLDAQAWSPVVSVNLQESQFVWPDFLATGNRFYRARNMSLEQPVYAQNFRLIDHQGKSRELFYYANDTAIKAIVLVFTRGNYTDFAAKITKLKTNSAYSSKVLFWTIDTDSNLTRTNVAQQATAAGISWPVFQDPLQLVTHDYDPHVSGEVFVIENYGGSIAYRGLIDDSIGVAAITLSSASAR